jgi:hypothetical protein
MQLIQELGILLNAMLQMSYYSRIMAFSTVQTLPVVLEMVQDGLSGSTAAWIAQRAMADVLLRHGGKEDEGLIRP